MATHRSTTSRPRLLSDTQVSVQSAHKVPVIPELEDYLSLPRGTDGTMLKGLRDSAKEQLASMTGHYVDQQTRRAAFDVYAERYRLPSAPVSSLDKVETTDEGSLTTETVSEWWLEDSVTPTEIRAKDAAGLTNPYDAVRFEYTAGYATRDDIPQRIETTLKKMIVDMYEWRASGEVLENTLEEVPAQWKPMMQGIQVPYAGQPKSDTDSFFI